MKFERLGYWGHDIDTSVIPQDCIDDCSAPGSVDEAVEYWVKELSIEAPKDKAADFLRTYGAWDDDELADHDQNLRRILWVICGDVAEEQATAK